MEIKRDLYLDKLCSRRWNGMIKVVTGIRRCGKSYLLFTIFKNRLLSEGVDPKDIIEFKLEEMEAVSLRDPVALYEHVRSLTSDGRRRRRYVFIDEIQMVPRIKNTYLEGGEDIRTW